MGNNNPNSGDNDNEISRKDGNSAENQKGDSTDSDENSGENQKENSVEIQDEKTMVETEEYAPEIRDIYKGIKDIKGESQSPKEENTKDHIIKSIKKKKKRKKRKLPKNLGECLESVPLKKCEVSLDEPGNSAVEIVPNEENSPKDIPLTSQDQNQSTETAQNEENVPSSSLPLNIRPRKYRKRVKMSEEYILQNYPGALRRSPRIIDKQFQADVLRNLSAIEQNYAPCSEGRENSTSTENHHLIQNSIPSVSATCSKAQKKKSILQEDLENSEAKRKKELKLKESFFSKQTYLNEAPTSFERLFMKNGRRFFGFRWTGFKKIIDVPEEKLTEPMKILLKNVLQSTLTDVNNPLYFEPVDDTSKDYQKTPASSVENNANFSNFEYFGFEKTLIATLNYRREQSQKQYEHTISNKDVTPSDTDVKFHIE